MLIKHKNVLVNEEFDDYPNLIEKIEMHSQLRANLERMEIKEIRMLQKIIFNLLKDKKNVVIKTDKLSSFDKRFSFLFPSIWNMLSIKKIPKPDDATKETSYPMTIIIEKDKEIINDLWENAKMLCNNTGIHVIKYYSKSENNFYKICGKTELLITSPDRIQEFLRNGLISTSHLENIVINNFNTLKIWEKKIIDDLAHMTRRKIHLTVIASRMTENLLQFRKRYLYDHYFISYTNKDKVEDNYDEDEVIKVKQT